MTDWTSQTDATFTPIQTGDERRGATRHLCHRVCYARPNGTNAGMTWGVAIRDISQTGISVVLRSRLEPGLLLALQPTRESGLEMLYAQIVRILPEPDGSWLYGCQLVKPLSDEELAGWLAE